MLPSQAATIFSIAISVRLEAILDPPPMQPPAVSVANWGQIQRSARTFGGVVDFPQLATLGRRDHPSLSAAVKIFAAVSRLLRRFASQPVAGFQSNVDCERIPRKQRKPRKASPEGDAL